MSALDDLLARLGNQSAASPSGGVTPQSATDAYRPSVNVQHDPTDALTRFFLEAGTFMPDDMRRDQGRPELSPADRGALLQAMNNRRTHVDPSLDLLGLGRLSPMGPSHPEPASPEMLQSLLAGPSLNAPSFQKRSDDAVFANSISQLLSGASSPESPASSAISAAAGRIDPSIIELLYGRKAQ